MTFFPREGAVQDKKSVEGSSDFILGCLASEIKTTPIIVYFESPIHNKFSETPKELIMKSAQWEGTFVSGKTVISDGGNLSKVIFRILCFDALIWWMTFHSTEESSRPSMAIHVTLFRVNRTIAFTIAMRHVQWMWLWGRISVMMFVLTWCSHVCKSVSTPGDSHSACQTTHKSGKKYSWFNCLYMISWSYKFWIPCELYLTYGLLCEFWFIINVSVLIIKKSNSLIN